MFRYLSVAIVLIVMVTGCAPMMRLSPREEMLILLPENSTASISGHFQKEERHTYWFHQAFNNELPTPIDTLAHAADNRPIRNVKIASSPDWLRLSLKIAGGIGAWALLTSASPATQPYGPLAYFLVLFAVPDVMHFQVEGDFAEEDAPGRVEDRL